MKKLCILSMVAVLTLFAACGKQQTEEERNAEIERQVQQRLAAEKQADDQQRLAQSQADLAAREKALSDREAAVTTSTPTATPRVARVSETPRRALQDKTEHRSSASYGTFYRKLEPYGAWLETNDYGYVWQPRQAEESRGWRPYTEGRWVYTDAGWTWVSEEPFGWATYHYGRWVRLRNTGWCWVPGEEWAPAWVSWRTSTEYVGWAPLPPEARFDRRSGIHNWADNYYDIGPEQYSFVSANELGSQRIERAVVPAERNVTIVNQTTNVTNITYNNTTIVNQGPNFEELRTRSSQPIERYRLETRTDISDESARPIVRGGMISMAAPVIGLSNGYERPATVRERLTQAVVETGWGAIADRSAAEKTRAKMKAEATPPPEAPSRTFVKPGNATDAQTAASTAPPSVAPMTTPVATEGPVLTPKPRATATPAPSASPTATATPTPASTPLPVATAKPAASAASTPGEATAPSPSATMNSRDLQHRAAEDTARQQNQAKAAAQEQKRAAEAANKLQEKQAHQAQRAEQEARLNELRNARRSAPAPSESPAVAQPLTPRPTQATASTPAAETSQSVPSPSASAPASAIVTPPPSEGTTDARRHGGGKKPENARRIPPSEPAAATAGQAEPDAAADASATPAAGAPVAKPKKEKNRHPNEPKPLEGAGPEVMDTPTPAPQ